MRFNNSRLQQFLNCPRSFKHRYLSKVVPRKRSPFFVLGEAIHKFIEFYYRTKDAKLSLRQVENVFAKVNTETFDREEMHDFQVDLNIALGIAEAYPSFYKQDFDQFSKILTEQQFEFPLGDTGHIYFGTLDGLFLDHAGDWWIFETKTASAVTLNDGYFERVKIDSQVAGYMHGAKHLLGQFPAGIIYNVIKKPSIRLKKGETLAAFQARVKMEYTKLAQVKAYFTRDQLMVATHRLDSWLADTSDLVVMLADKIKRKDRKWIMNTGSCTAKFGICPYMPACVSNNYNKLIYEKDTSGK